MEDIRLRGYISSIIDELKNMLLDIFLCEKPDNVEKLEEDNNNGNTGNDGGAPSS